MDMGHTSGHRGQEGTLRVRRGREVQVYVARGRLCNRENAWHVRVFKHAFVGKLTHFEKSSNTAFCAFLLLLEGVCTRHHLYFPSK